MVFSLPFFITAKKNKMLNIFSTFLNWIHMILLCRELNMPSKKRKVCKNIPKLIPMKIKKAEFLPPFQ